MPIVKASTKIAEIALDDPDIIPLLSRLGISPGYGDMTVDDAAAATGSDPGFMLMLINTWLVDDYFPQSRLRNVHLSDIINYLSLTNDYYLQFRLPNIDRHFGALMHSNHRAGGDGEKLMLIKKLYDKLKSTIIQRISYDRDILFPSVTAAKPAKSFDMGLDPAESLTDLRSMLVIHISGITDANLWYAVIVAIDSLEKDIRNNDRIRSLLPISVNTIPES